jgi:hypothetical protein
MRNLVGLYFVLFSLCTWSQSARLVHAKIAIGEQTELVYKVELDSKEGAISYIPHQNTISAYKKFKNGTIDSTNKIELEIVGSFKDSIQYGGRKYTWIGTYTITSWDTGKYVIPAINLATQKGIHRFNDVELVVIAPQVDDQKDIYDIKEQFADVDGGSNWFSRNWMYLLLTVLLVLALFYWYKKRKAKKTEPIIERSLTERTLAEIEALEHARLWEKEDYKAHYVAFSMVLRKYLSEKYQLNLLEKTSNEALLLLKQKAVETTLLELIKQQLSYADMIKFAKSSSSGAAVLKHIEELRNLVLTTNRADVI